MPRRRAPLSLAWALLLACEGPGGATDARPDMPDAGSLAAMDAGAIDAGAIDAGASADAGSMDAGPTPDAGGGDASTPWIEARLSDGTTVTGERVADYDHRRWWWSPADRETWAVFDPRRLAPWPDDRSMRFVDARAVEAAISIDRPAELPTFAAAMREGGLVIERVPLDGVAHVITGNERYHLDEDGYGDFAWDLVRHDATGARHEGTGAANEDYFVWDAPVLAPVAGIVVEVVRDAPDQPPGTPDLEAVNNLVGIQVHGAYYVYLLHFRDGSVPSAVAIGARVEVGDLLGRVGNSGVSAEPHLHLTAMALDHESAPLRTWSVPASWRDVWITRDGASRLVPWATPESGDALSASAP